MNGLLFWLKIIAYSLAYITTNVILIFLVYKEVIPVNFFVIAMTAMSITCLILIMYLVIYSDK